MISMLPNFGKLNQLEEKLAQRLAPIEQQLQSLSNRIPAAGTESKVVISTDEITVVQVAQFFFAFPPSQLNHALSYLNPSFDLGMRTFIAKFAKPGGHFVDIGANCGTLTAIAARVVGPQGKVVAVEPIGDLGPFIRRNAVLNAPLTPFELHTCCAGAEDGEVSFQVFEFDNRVSTQFSYGDTGMGDQSKTIEAKVRPAKDLVPAGDNPLFVKIDAEGNEMAILNSLTGADNPIGERDMTIVFEYAEEHFRRAGSDPAELVKLLERIGAIARYMNPLTGEPEQEFGEKTFANPGNLIVWLPDGLTTS